MIAKLRNRTPTLLIAKRLDEGGRVLPEGGAERNGGRIAEVGVQTAADLMVVADELDRGRLFGWWHFIVAELSLPKTRRRGLSSRRNFPDFAPVGLGSSPDKIRAQARSTSPASYNFNLWR